MWLWRRRSSQDFAAEIESQIDRETVRLVEEKGLSRDEACAAARRAFGNVTRARETFYESTRWLWLDDLRRDLTYAVRTLLANPGFTAVTLITLALGIGADTAIFTLVNATMLKPLVVHSPFSRCSISRNTPAR
jgi:hypothetical protein